MPLRVGITCPRVPGPCLVLLFSQYACGIEAEVVGKPSPEFFKSALREMGVDASQVGRLLLKRVRRGSCWGETQGSPGWPWSQGWVWGLKQPGGLWQLPSCTSTES